MFILMTLHGFYKGMFHVEQWLNEELLNEELPFAQSSSTALCIVLRMNRRNIVR